MLLTALMACAFPGPLWAQAIPPPIGTEVSVLLGDGARSKGRLVALSSSEVVLRRYPQAPEIRHRLTDVRRVETVHHNRRNLALAGLGVGVVAAMLGDWCGGGADNPTSEPDCVSPMPALVAAGGAAAGALIGHALDSRQRRILFVAPAGTSSRAPLTRRGFVIGATLRW